MFFLDDDYNKNNYSIFKVCNVLMIIEATLTKLINNNNGIK